MRIAVLCVSALILASCATPSLPDPGPIEQPAAEACDPRLTAPIEVEPPVVGTIVQPVTPDEVDGTRTFLNGEAEARSWGRRGWDRAAVAQASCRNRGSSPTG